MRPRWPHLLILAAIVVAFAFGRFTARTPDERLEIAEREEVRAGEEIEEAIEEAFVSEVQEERVRIVYRDRWRTPEGAERETEIEMDAEALRELTQEARVETRVEIREVEVVREVEVERVIRTPLPDWRIGGMLGLEFDGGSPAYGLQVERRILGPVHVGAWGISTGAAGILLGVEF